jgi:hypothetical protein
VLVAQYACRGLTADNSIYQLREMIDAGHTGQELCSQCALTHQMAGAPIDIKPVCVTEQPAALTQHILSFFQTADVCVSAATGIVLTACLEALLGSEVDAAFDVHIPLLY